MENQVQETQEDQEEQVDLTYHPEKVQALADLIDKAYAENGYAHDTFEALLTLWEAALYRFDAGKEEVYMEQVRRLPAAVIDLAVCGHSMLLQHFFIDRCFHDLLGPVYMQLASKWKQSGLGQFFTPWNIAIAMSEITFADQDIDRPIKVCDPCVGSGVMLLAARAVATKRHGYLAASRVQVYGQDIDRICVLMSRIQCALSDPIYMSDLMLATWGELQEAAEAS
jgi:hypothetical protein